MLSDADKIDIAAILSKGDERAFRRLHARHTPGLYAFVQRMLGAQSSETDDVIQDVWLRAVGSLDTFKAASTLRTWLLGIALNRCREQWRVRDDATELTDDTFAQHAGDVHVKLDVERALATLPSGYRAVLVLHDVEGFTHEEIAAQLGIEPGTSKSQLSRARSELRRRLQS